MDDEISTINNIDPTPDLLADLMDGRNDLFQRTLNMVPHRDRTIVLNGMLMNEYAYISLLTRIHSSYNRNQTMTAFITVSNPNLTGFTDPVPVLPSSTHIINAVSYETVSGSGNDCAICQESITGEMARLRHCRHVYHRTCLTTWFQSSVRCPVCRHDIRETGQEDGTSPASTQTSSQ